MIEDVVFFNHTEQVKSVFNKLSSCSHNGFPVVDEQKHVIGLISRNHLVAILRNKYFVPNAAPSAYSIHTG